MGQTLTTEILPIQRRHRLLKDACTVIGASIIISLCAPLSFPLPFTPVPIAIAAQVVLLLSVLLGSQRATLAVIAYLLQGAAGLPVFAAGGAVGLLRFVGPTGGYLLGYILAAFVTGLICEKMKQRTEGKVFAAMVVGNLIIFICGLAHLSHFVPMGSLLFLGFFPFIGGEIVKLILAQRALKALKFFKGSRF
ncbi:MAG TPA: biotin transporter BioY [Rhabdochlamydiaceae bacterium]|nr:biotin transporter BioY [Rhabdochlamydiaceae bacterium]